MLSENVKSFYELIKKLGWLALIERVTASNKIKDLKKID